MAYLGSWKINDYLTIPLQCSRFSSGAAYDATGSPAYRIYEDETSTAILTGSFAILDDANTTGFYTVRIQLTAANGFGAGQCYTVWKSATVDGVAGASVDTFQIQAEVVVATIGTPVALDGGTATIAGMLTKIADNNGGADYVAATDSLTEMKDASASVDNIVDGILDEALASHVTADSLAVAMKAVLDDTGTSGVIVASIANNAITAASMNADAGAEIADAVWDEAKAGHTTPATYGVYLDQAVSATPSAAAISDAVWDEVLAQHLTSGSTGAGLNAAGSAGDPWSTALPGAYGAGSAGKIVGDNLNAPVATVDTVVDAIKAKTDYLPSATAGTTGGLFIAGTNAATSITTALTANVIGNVTGNVSGSISSVTGAVGSVTGNVGGNVVGSVASVTAPVTTGTISTDAISTGAVSTAAANEIADALLDRSAGIETGLTPRQALRVIAAASAGKLAGAGTTNVTIDAANNTGTTRISAVVDSDGNRTSVTVSP